MKAETVCMGACKKSIADDGFIGVHFSTSAQMLAQKLAEAQKAVSAIDLSMVKHKLMDAEEGQGWGQTYADYAEKRYRHYLTMLYLDRSGAIVPTKEIDLFWHQHILDTRAYADDCARVFGEFIHHFPYFGMRGDEDLKNLESSFEYTKRLYQQLFGEPYVDPTADAGAGKCTKCGKGYCHHPPRCSN